MWTRTFTHSAKASAADVWRLLADVSSWIEWSPGFGSIGVDGPFEVGSTICSVTREGQEIYSRILAVDPGRSFTDLTTMGAAEIRVRHQVKNLGDQSAEVAFTMQVSGEISEQEATDLGSAVSEQIPAVLQSLAALSAER